MASTQNLRKIPLSLVLPSSAVKPGKDGALVFWKASPNGKWPLLIKPAKGREELVEPLTNYFVGRLQKDIKSGNTVIGGIVTGVNREKGLENRLHSGAYSGGLDFLHYWKGRTWYIRGNMVFSHVQGTKEAILRTQTSLSTLFQRADAKEVS
jgi:hypothetical protein